MIYLIKWKDKISNLFVHILISMGMGFILYSFIGSAIRAYTWRFHHVNDLVTFKFFNIAFYQVHYYKLFAEDVGKFSVGIPLLLCSIFMFIILILIEILVWKINKIRKVD